MAARKEIVRQVIAEGMCVTKALSIAEVPKSSFYYKPSGKRKGKAVSTHTIKGSIPLENSVVVEEIKSLLGEEFVDYGYERTTEELKSRGFKINKKKVYRLMKENGLLFPKVKRRSLGRSFVEYTVPLATRPLEVIEIDFKYIYIEGYKRHAYLITMLDVFSRTALVWELNLTMKATDVVRLVDKLITGWLKSGEFASEPSSIKIRTDNGSQFIAADFRNCLELNGISNEYTHPGTPEQNAHIESFHNTLERLVCSKYSFDTIHAAEEVLERFFYVYNNKRIMKAILYMAPMVFMEQWSEGKIGCKRENKRIKYFLKKKLSELKSENISTDAFLFQSQKNEIYNTFINQTPI